MQKKSRNSLKAAVREGWSDRDESNRIAIGLNWKIFVLIGFVWIIVNVTDDSEDGDHGLS